MRSKAMWWRWPWSDSAQYVELILNFLVKIMLCAWISLSYGNVFSSYSVHRYTDPWQADMQKYSTVAMMSHNYKKSTTIKCLSRCHPDKSLSLRLYGRVILKNPIFVVIDQPRR